MRGLRLSLKLPMLIIMAVLLTAGACGLLAIVLGRRIMQETVLEANINSAQTYASAIDFYLNNARSDLETTADLSEITRMMSAQFVDPTQPGLGVEIDRAKRAIAAKILKHSKVFEYIVLLQADGFVYLLEPYALQFKLSRHDLAFTAWYKDVIRSGATVISDLHISPATQRPTIVIATPVRGAGKQIIGVWAGGLKLEELSQIGHGGLERGTLQRYGHVTDRRGLIIAHQATPKYVQEQTDFSAVPPVRAALAGQSGVMQYVNPIEGVEKLAAYLPLAGPLWTVVYAVPAHLAFAPIAHLTRRIMLISAGLAAFLGLLSVYMVRRIVGPLDQLTAAAARIGTGDLTSRIEVRTGDELERLAQAFNQMVAALSEQETQLRQHAAQLQQANSELEAFAYSISHDLRAPLRAMNGFSHILLEEHAPHLQDEAQRYLSLVRDNAQHMGQLIDDLLTFSRLSRQPLKLQPVACANLVRQVLAELAHEHEGRRVDIAIGEMPLCQADPALLKQVFVNLLANALKFTRQRDPAVLTIGCREHAGEPVYFVQDNGVGFDMRYVDKLFRVFQRLHRAEEYEGTGVGLAIVQRIIHRHGGRVWGEAAVNQGATFCFTLGGDIAHD
jgi:signal transduction histidine kinase